jgi:glycosyltransferase involved in cell wall biosynthesis
MLLVEQYPPDINVAGLRMHEMVNTFSEQEDVEIRVVVYNPVSKSRYLKHYSKISDKVSVVRYGRKYLPGLFHLIPSINPFTLLCCIFFSIKETINYKPDIIITTVPSFIPTIAAYITSIICKNPFCIDIRDNWINTNIIDYRVKLLPLYAKYPSKIMYKMLYLMFLRSCKNALLLSIVYESMRDDLLKHTNFKIPILHVPNGVNFSELEEITQKTDRNRVLVKYGLSTDSTTKSIIYIGELGGYYKPEILLEPLKRLVKKGYYINYIIVGDGKSKDTLKEMAIEKGIKDYVFLMGKKKHSEVIELLLASDMAFYTLDKDFPNPDCALGTKVLEYIACKLPVLSVADNNSIVSELIFKHKIGIALNWDETAQMDVVILKLLESPEYSKNIGRYYPHFIEEFDRKTNNSRLYGVMIKYYHRNQAR